MGRNLRTLGLATIAVLALSALSASTASAEFTSGSDSTILTSQALSAQQFTDKEEHEWSCNELSFDETTMGTAQSEITARPTFGTCITRAGAITAEARVDPNGCHFLLTADGEVHITCPEGAEIKVTEKILGSFRECLDIPAQTPTESSVDYNNGTDAETGKMDIEVESTIEGITYEKTGVCATGENEDNDWKFIGQFTLTGVNQSSEPVDVTAN